MSLYQILLSNKRDKMENVLQKMEKKKFILEIQSKHGLWLQKPEEMYLCVGQEIVGVHE